MYQINTIIVLMSLILPSAIFFCGCDDNDIEEEIGFSRIGGTLIKPETITSTKLAYVNIFDDNPETATSAAPVAPLDTVSVLSGAGSFTFELDRDRTYYLTAFQDLDENGLYSSSPTIEPYAIYSTTGSTSASGIALVDQDILGLEMTLTNTTAPPAWFAYAGNTSPLSLGGEIDVATPSLEGDGVIYVMLFDIDLLDPDVGAAYDNILKAKQTRTFNAVPATYRFDNLLPNKNYYVVAFWEIEIASGDINGIFSWGDDLAAAWDNQPDITPTAINLTASRDDIDLELVLSDDGEDEGESDLSEYITWLRP